MSDSNADTLPTWRLIHLEETGSTNDTASKEAGWTAVTAKRQTKGRGRYRRSWVSDAGGIWISCVLPTPGKADSWAILPLAAGWALKESLASLGVQNLRLRWPNDLMTGTAKLAGILVERYNPTSAVVGIGINYKNQPAASNPELTGLVTRLTELLNPLPSQDKVIQVLLNHLSVAQRRIASGKTREFLPSLNSAWQIEKVAVTLQPDSRRVTGAFYGVDELGRLLMRCEDGTELLLNPNDVELLRELR